MNELKCFFKQMLKVSAFYLEKQKSFILKYFLSRCQYQNKKALFTHDPIFSEGFGTYHRKQDCGQEIQNCIKDFFAGTI